MQLSLYASLHFQICDIRRVLNLQGLVISVYMSFLQLVDIEQCFLTRCAHLKFSLMLPSRGREASH